MSPDIPLPSDWFVIPLKNVAEYFIDGDWIETPFIEESGIRLIQTGNIGIGTFLSISRIVSGLFLVERTGLCAVIQLRRMTSSSVGWPILSAARVKFQATLAQRLRLSIALSFDQIRKSSVPASPYIGSPRRNIFRLRRTKLAGRQENALAAGILEAYRC